MEKEKFNPVFAFGPAILAGALWLGLSGNLDRKREAGDAFVQDNTSPELVLRDVEDGQLEKVASAPVPVSPPVLKKVERVPVSYKTNDGSFSGDSDKVLLARMIYGEARSESRSERVAIAYTVLNRIGDGKKWNGETVQDVILTPSQYACFNLGNPNREKLMNPEHKDYSPKEWNGCLDIAGGVLSGKFSDPTNGATNYFTDKTPKWAKNMESTGRVNRGPHTFYRPARRK